MLSERSCGAGAFVLISVALKDTEVVSKTYALPFALGDGVHLPLAGALLLPRGAL